MLFFWVFFRGFSFESSTNLLKLVLIHNTKTIKTIGELLVMKNNNIVVIIDYNHIQILFKYNNITSLLHRGNTTIFYIIVQ